MKLNIDREKRIENYFNSIIDGDYWYPKGTTWPFDIKLPTFNKVGFIMYSDGKGMFEMDIPGIKQEEVKITLSSNILVITAKSERNSKKREYSSNITVSEEYDQDKIEATLEDGVLSITFGLADKVQPPIKNIEVKTIK